MGYNTWYDFMCKLTADDVQRAADSLVRYGLDKLGYNYVNLDDCWATSRDSKGVIQADPVGFPQGMKAVADYVHSKGLKFGVYTDRGMITCARRPASKNYERIDAQTYASWGVDFLKEDSCNATQDQQGAIQEYATMRDALNATGRPILFSLCGWHDWYAPVGDSLSNMWRIAGDGQSWPAVIRNVNVNAKLGIYAKPGAWNDPDMLLGSSAQSAVHLLPVQSRTQFSLWSIMASPLLLSASILNLTPFDLETYSNKALIAINQDPLGIQGRRVQGDDLVFSNPVPGKSSTRNVWAKPLSTGQTAVIFLSTDPQAVPADCGPDCFARANLTKSQYRMLDVWTQKDLGIVSKKVGYKTKPLAANGGSLTVLLTPV